MCERVWRIVQDCAKKQGLAARSRGWLVACKLPKYCTRVKHARSWRVTPAVALQDKSQVGQAVCSRLELATQPSREVKLLEHLVWEKLTFHIPSHPTIYILLHPRFWEGFQREFWERNPKEKQDWFIHNFYLRDSSNSSTFFLSIVKSLRGLLPKPYLTISISVRELFGV